MRYLFQLGREPELSAAELKAVFSLLTIDYRMVKTALPYLIVETKAPLDVESLMRRLGGTIKISERINGSIEFFLLQAQPTGKITFSLSGGRGKKEALALKKNLAASGRSVRYIEPKNTATILHNELTLRQGDITHLGDDFFVTRAIQPIEAFSLRDYGRPGRDAKSGMLPPKLAKIMVNLANMPSHAVILDPFCGSGTILMEAALMGYADLIGSDISPKAIDDTKKNLQWLQHENPHANIHMPKLMCADARKIDKKLPPHSVDAIVTEPFLGKPLRENELASVLQTQTKELKKLYDATLAACETLLKPTGTIVMIIPSFRHGKNWIHVPFSTRMKKEGPLLYARPDQRVGREIWIFKKEG